jgi:hypothetical protein
MELKIKKETAKKIYADAPDSLKEILVETFGRECFQKRTFNEIKTFEDACEELSVIPGDVTGIGCTSDEIAYKKLKVIVKAINQGWIPDWSNSDQHKWNPWFNLSSGFGFSYTAYYYDYSNSSVGSRLCFESEEKARYTANQFLDLYKRFLT